MFIEVYRDFIPTNKIISDNVSEHWRAHANKMKYHGNRMRNILDGSISMPEFTLPEKEDVNKIAMKGKPFLLYIEFWKFQDITYDHFNYTTTLKAQIDVLTSIGFWPDDNWKFVGTGMVGGGGASEWSKRAIRYDGDNLPDELTSEWWKEHAPINSTFARMFASDIQPSDIKNIL